ncbi:MAG: glycyl-radical enzyme activating protein [Eubacteriales bacterium]|nr:glycyl-radical enzyme activating protein [Eubacteriales bacterium]
MRQNRSFAAQGFDSPYLKMLKAQIINIQKYSIHDGEGIRTVVFFKGCPLACLWCHNPESRRFESELLFNAEKCTLCLACVPVCPNRAIVKDEKTGKPNAVFSSCSACGACESACLFGAREIVGKLCTVEELMDEIDKDTMFYEQSGGGITLSGGEVMAADMDFVEELLRRCKKRGYSVNIDTCGYAPYENFERVLRYTDAFLYDVKLADPKKHMRYTGRDNALILENLKKLGAAGARIIIRMPLIEGVNCADEDVFAVLELLRPLHIEGVHLLPYHGIGRHKAERMGLSAPAGMAPPGAERLNAIKAHFENRGYEVKIGG